MADFISTLRSRIRELELLNDNELASTLRDFENEVTTSVKLSAYNARQFDELLKPLRDRVKKGKSKTFSFKRKDDVSSPQGQEQPEPESSNNSKSVNTLEPSGKPQDASVPLPSKLSDAQGGPQLIEVHDASGGDVSFSNLTGSILFVTVQVEALTLSNLTDCRVYVASVVRSSLVVRDAVRCEFHCRSKQVRIHNAVDCSFFVQTVTPPIIEKSSGLKFGPYSLQLVTRSPWHDDDCVFDEMSLTNYQRVQDFNWLKPKQSPNWSVIEKQTNGAETQSLRTMLGIEF